MDEYHLIAYFESQKPVVRFSDRRQSHTCSRGIFTSRRNASCRRCSRDWTETGLACRGRAAGPYLLQRRRSPGTVLIWYPILLANFVISMISRVMKGWRPHRVTAFLIKAKRRPFSSGFLVTFFFVLKSALFTRSVNGQRTLEALFYVRIVRIYFCNLRLFKYFGYVPNLRFKAYIYLTEILVIIWMFSHTPLVRISLGLLKFQTHWAIFTSLII